VLPLAAALLACGCATVDLMPGDDSETEAPLSAAQQSLRESALELETISETGGWEAPDGMRERVKRWTDMLLHGVSGDDEPSERDPIQAYLEAGAEAPLARAETDMNAAASVMETINDAARGVLETPSTEARITEDLRILEASAQRALRVETFFADVLAAADAATGEDAFRRLAVAAERMAALADQLADQRRALQDAAALG